MSIDTKHHMTYAVSSSHNIDSYELYVGRENIGHSLSTPELREAILDDLNR